VKVKPGSWNEAIHHAVDRGELPPEACPVVTIDYMGPSLDTTVFAISSAVWLFAQHPERWDLVREDPSLTPGAISEVLPAGSRAIMDYGAGNRDERHYPDPDCFDVRRKPGRPPGLRRRPTHLCRPESRANRNAGCPHRTAGSGVSRSSRPSAR
jgi:cytochrome P450